MKANCSYNSGELWTVCVSLNMGEKMREFPRGKNPQFVTKKSMWEQHGSMPEEYIWTGALGEYPSPSPLLKDEVCTIWRREITYPRSQSKFVSRPRAWCFSSIILYHVVLQEWEMHEGKRYSFNNWILFSLSDIIEHLGGVQRKLIIPSPPHCIHKACINIQCESFLPFVTILKSNFLFMFYMLLESLWCSDFPLHSILFNSLELFGSNSSRNNYHAGDHGALHTHVGRLLSIRGCAGCWRKEII